MVYVSTDYVFDGKNAPYKESDEPNPLNKYGKSKLDGEKTILTFKGKVSLFFKHLEITICPKYNRLYRLNVYYSKKFSCVNSRGIPPAAQQVLAVLLCLLEGEGT